MRSKPYRIFSVLLVLILTFMIYGCSASSSYKEDAVVQTSPSIADRGELEYNGQMVLNDDKDITLERKLVYNLEYTILVPNPNKAVNKIMEQTNALNGYMVESRLSADNGETSHARLVVKIPQDKMKQMSAYLESMGTVDNQTMYTDDVTTEYYDTEARLKVLQKEEEQMLSFMDDKSATIQDLLAIEREIAQVREKRESLQARMNVLMNQTAYSQFNIQLQTSFQEVTTPQGTFSKAKTALIKSINSMLLLFNWLVITFFVLLPYLVLLALAFAVVMMIKKRRSQKKE